jgi:hypothetical protein
VGRPVPPHDSTGKCAPTTDLGLNAGEWFGAIDTVLKVRGARERTIERCWHIADIFIRVITARDAFFTGSNITLPNPCHCTVVSRNARRHGCPTPLGVFLGLHAEARESDLSSGGTT